MAAQTPDSDSDSPVNLNVAIRHGQEKDLEFLGLGGKSQEQGQNVINPCGVVRNGSAMYDVFEA